MHLDIADEQGAPAERPVNGAPASDKGGRSPEPPSVATHRARLVFTGIGSEYFRIWVTNLLLTLLTLGAYSAWAKVRKTRYFHQNTRLDGDVFDFHGNPWAIFRGRVLAVVLLAAYTYSFDFSRDVGFATIVLLILVGPWLFLRAQQFRFRNSSWRGLRFGFVATPGDAYRAVLPILLVWFSTTVTTALVTRDEPDWTWWVFLASIMATLIAAPGMHHRLKAFQHGHATYGDRRFAFQPALRRFYWTYFKASGLIFVAGTLAAFLVSGTALVTPDDPDPIEALLGYFAGAMGALLMYTFTWPYIAARLQQVTWESTTLGDACFRTDIRAWALFKLVLRNVALTLVTAGLYWPFASIALARYRIECMHVDSDIPLGWIAAGTARLPTAAFGDAAADAFGLDIGL